MPGNKPVSVAESGLVASGMETTHMVPTSTQCCTSVEFMWRLQDKGNSAITLEYAATHPSICIIVLS